MLIKLIPVILCSEKKIVFLDKSYMLWNKILWNTPNPFTDEKRNATRIAIIIVDIAGEILRKKLEEIILNKGNFYGSIRYDKKSYKETNIWLKCDEGYLRYYGSLAIWSFISERYIITEQTWTQQPAYCRPDKQLQMYPIK